MSAIILIRISIWSKPPTRWCVARRNSTTTTASYDRTHRSHAYAGLRVYRTRPGERQAAFSGPRLSRRRTHVGRGRRSARGRRLSDDRAVRTGEIAALARDVLDLADALGIDTFDYVGHDWGARAGYAIAALSPKRLGSITALAVAYGTNVAAQSLSVEQLRAYWYQWYFATPRGEDALRRDRRTFCRDLWRTWSPHWRFEEATYAATAASFDNPDFEIG